MRSINSNDLFTFYISSECNIGQLLLLLHFFFHFGNDMNRESEIMSLLQMKSAIPCLRKGLRAVEAFVTDIQVYCLHMLDCSMPYRGVIPAKWANEANLRTTSNEHVSILCVACNGKQTRSCWKWALKIIATYRTLFAQLSCYLDKLMPMGKNVGMENLFE